MKCVIFRVLLLNRKSVFLCCACIFSGLKSRKTDCSYCCNPAFFPPCAPTAQTADPPGSRSQSAREAAGERNSENKEGRCEGGGRQRCDGWRLCYTRWTETCSHSDGATYAKSGEEETQTFQEGADAAGTQMICFSHNPNFSLLFFFFLMSCCVQWHVQKLIGHVQIFILQHILSIYSPF